MNAPVGARARIGLPLVSLLLVAGCGGTVPAGSAAAEPVATPRLEPCEGTPALDAVTDGAPDVALTCFGSQERVQLSALRGRPTLVNLWASWCAPCRREMPLLQAMHDRVGDRVRFLGVNVSDERSSALDFLATKGISYPQAVDPSNTLPVALGVPGLPITIVVDAVGAVVYRKFGELSETDLQDALGAAGG